MSVLFVGFYFLLVGAVLKLGSAKSTYKHCNGRLLNSLLTPKCISINTDSWAYCYRLHSGLNTDIMIYLLIYIDLYKNNKIRDAMLSVSIKSKFMKKAHRKGCKVQK